MIRPGIAFALDSDGLDQTKARGVGKSTLAKAKTAVLKQWELEGAQSFILRQTMFHGWKSCTSYVQGEYKRHENYGLWKPRETEVRYTSEPKRPFIFREDGGLHTWAFNKDIVSSPYQRIINAELAALKLREIIENEQPDRQELDNEF